MSARQPSGTRWPISKRPVTWINLILRAEFLDRGYRFYVDEPMRLRALPKANPRRLELLFRSKIRDVVSF